MSRDSQRSKVYAADKRLHQWAQKNRVLVQYKSAEAMQAVSDTMYGWARGNLTPLNHAFPPRVEWNGRVKGAKAYSYSNRMVFSTRRASADFILSNVILCHEMAHILAPHDEKHGARYCAIYLQLVQQFLGNAAAAVLLDLFRELGVKYSAKPSRPRRTLTPEQKAALVERLQRGRAARLEAKVAVAV